jgi:hypothetical protein
MNGRGDNFLTKPLRGDSKPARLFSDKGNKMQAYRFYSKYGKHVKNFASDDQAFDYASENNDGGSGDIQRIEKLKDGDAFVWDVPCQAWVYCGKW